MVSCATRPSIKRPRPAVGLASLFGLVGQGSTTQSAEMAPVVAATSAGIGFPYVVQTLHTICQRQTCTIDVYNGSVSLSFLVPRDLMYRGAGCQDLVSSQFAFNSRTVISRIPRGVRVEMFSAASCGKRRISLTIHARKVTVDAAVREEIFETARSWFVCVVRRVIRPSPVRQNMRSTAHKICSD